MKSESDSILNVAAMLVAAPLPLPAVQEIVAVAPDVKENPASVLVNEMDEVAVSVLVKNDDEEEPAKFIEVISVVWESFPDSSNGCASVATECNSATPFQ